jgi:hypothetical protein
MAKTKVPNIDLAALQADKGYTASGIFDTIKGLMRDGKIDTTEAAALMQDPDYAKLSNAWKSKNMPSTYAIKDAQVLQTAKDGLDERFNTLLGGPTEIATLQAALSGKRNFNETELLALENVYGNLISNRGGTESLVPWKGFSNEQTTAYEAIYKEFMGSKLASIIKDRRAAKAKAATTEKERQAALIRQREIDAANYAKRGGIFSNKGASQNLKNSSAKSRKPSGGGGGQKNTQS